MGNHRSDEAQDRRAGGLRWWLLLLVLPVVVLVVLRLQPDDLRSVSPAPSGSGSAAAPDRSLSREGAAGVLPRTPAGRVDGSVTTRALPRQLRGITGRWDLFARGDRVVVRLDFGRDRLTTTPVPRLQGDGPVSFVATGVGVIVHPYDWSPGYLVPDGRPAHELSGALSRGGPLLPGPDPDHVWADVGETGHGGSIRLIGLSGRPDGPVIPKPDNVLDWISPDGDGHPLLQTSGGTYVVRRDGLRRVTTGAVLASGRTGWLVFDCDDRNVCTAKVVDRRTAGRTVLPRFRAAVVDALGRVGEPGWLSPDGAVAALVGRADDGGSALWLTNLTSGRSHRVALGSLRPSVTADSLAWSPDSRWLFVVTGRGAVRVVDARTRAVRALGVDLPAVRALALRTGPG